MKPLPIDDVTAGGSGGSSGECAHFDQPGAQSLDLYAVAGPSKMSQGQANLGSEASKLSHASIYLAANVLNAAIPFLLLPILTRVLTPAEYGTVATFEAAAACIAVFTGLSTHGAVAVHYYREDRATFSQYVGNCLMILFGSTIIMAGILAINAHLMVRFTGLTIFWQLLAVLVSFGQFLVNIRLVIWQVRNKAIRYGAFQIAQTSINAVVSLVLVLYLKWGGAGRIAGFASSVIVFGGIAWSSMQVKGWITWKWNPEYILDALRFGVPLIPHTLGTLAMAFADRFIIAKKLGMSATGDYFVAVQISMPLLMLGSSFNRAFVPWLFDKLSNNENTLAVLVSYLAIFGFLFCGLLYGSLIYFGLSHIVGEQYRETKSIALILIVGTTFQAAYYAIVNYIFYAKKTAYLSAITFVSGFLCVVGGWIIIPAYGLVGMAVFFTVIECLTFLLVWFVGSIILPQPWLDFSSMRQVVHNLAN